MTDVKITYDAPSSSWCVLLKESASEDTMCCAQIFASEFGLRLEQAQHIAVEVQRMIEQARQKNTESTHETDCVVSNLSPHGRLRYLRMKKGITRKQMSKDLDVSWQTIQKWEQGLAYPKRTRLDEVADYLGVSIIHLLG